jgi:hypothetical protein
MGRMLKELFLGMRETVLGTSGKIADSLTPHTPLDRAEIYNVIHAELCEMLEALSDPDGLAEAAAGQSKKASR